MRSDASEVPLGVQLQALCCTRTADIHALLVPHAPGLSRWRPNAGSADSYREHARRYFTFSASDLIAYLQSHPEACRSLILDSYDKRYTPSAFIEEWENSKYRVGWVNSVGTPLITDIRVFGSLPHAVADYILLSWGMPRLSKDQAAWIESGEY